MNFSNEYIEICRKLSPHEFEVYDYGFHYGEDKLGIGIITHIDHEIVIDGKRIPAVVLKTLDDKPLHTVSHEIFWLPHRESDWMKMEGWSGGWCFSFDGDWQIYDVDEQPILDDDSISNPLLACAKAWEKEKQ